MRSINHIAVSLLAAVGSVSGSSLEARAASAERCKRDVCLRSLLQSATAAVPFCNSYIKTSIGTTTSTVTYTVTPAPQTTTVTITGFGLFPRFTCTDETTTVTVPGDPITYYYNAPYPSNTKTILPSPPPTKRDAALEDRYKPWPSSSSSKPPFCSGVAKSVASACSCFTLTATATESTTGSGSTATVTIRSTFSPICKTVTSTVTGPRPTVSTCADYETTPLNAGYEYLNANDVANLTPLDNTPIYSGNRLECCNLCYETKDCVSYRFNNDHSVATCQRWATPVTPGSYGAGLSIIGYNQACPAGLVNGTRQPITERTDVGNYLRNPRAIGPCMNANWLN